MSAISGCLGSPFPPMNYLVSCGTKIKLPKRTKIMSFVALPHKATTHCVFFHGKSISRKNAGHHQAHE